MEVASADHMGKYAPCSGQVITQGVYKSNLSNFQQISRIHFEKKF